MHSSSTALAAGLLLVAGIYQWLPSKAVCLEHCRGPLHFLLGYWRPGVLGGWRMGLAHGAYCLGCCWALMGLLFVVGVMNLDRKSKRLNSSHYCATRMPSSA